jgi:multidrug resistance efflux pump
MVLKLSFERTAVLMIQLKIQEMEMRQEANRQKRMGNYNRMNDLDQRSYLYYDIFDEFKQQFDQQKGGQYGSKH